jgi:hypothetical protein
MVSSILIPPEDNCERGSDTNCLDLNRMTIL